MLHPPLEQIAHDSPKLDDELLAERIEIAGESWLADGGVPSLAELIRSIPLLRSRPLAFDAAIDVVLRGLLAQSISIQEATEQLREQAPEFHDAIEAHISIRSMIKSWVVSDTAPARPVGELPRAFGPKLGDGRPRYELVERVGSGSEGTVFRAFDRRLSADGRPLAVAIKILHRHEGDDPDRVLAEAARAMRVRHPSIAALLECGVDEEGPFLVYEFVAGQPLDRWRRRQVTVTPRSAAAIVRSLAAAVQVAHNAGVVHRDLKPTNVLIGDDGTPHITDFGLAAAMTVDPAMELVGSLGFAPPEQLRGERGGADALVDVYALGGLLYWLTTGRFPNGESATHIERDLEAGRAPSLEALGDAPDADRTIRGITERALSPDPATRYPSAAVLASDLERWLSAEPVLPFDENPLRRITLAARRSPTAAATVAMAAILVLVAIGAAWFFDAQRRNAEFDAERDRLRQSVELAEARAQHEERRISNAATMVRGFLSVLRQTQADSGDASWLPVVTAIESLAAQDALGLPSMEGDLSETRIVIVRNTLAKADASGQRNSVENVFWETALGYWLMKAGHYDEGRQVLEQNLERGREVLPAGDPWQRIIGSLHDLALIATADPGDREARVRLEESLPKLPAALRLFIQETLIQFAGQAMLD